MTSRAIGVLPALTTAPITDITLASAVSGGNITTNGGESFWMGVCRGTTPDPTTSNSITSDNGVIGDFQSYINGLQPLTKYYARAYATNAAGTIYGNELIFTTSEISSIIFNPNLTFGSVSDIEGNIYKTIQIGTQLWMVENLKTTKYDDGTFIPYITDNVEWSNLTTPGYSWFNNDASSFKNTYGALYNWYAINDSRNLCPTGWHVPTSTEWETLTVYLGANSAGKMKEAGTTHWLSPNTSGTNESGFTGLPGGIRSLSNSFLDPDLVRAFVSIGSHGLWWSANEYSTI